MNEILAGMGLGIFIFMVYAVTVASVCYAVMIKEKRR